MNPECYQNKAFHAIEKKRIYGRSWVAIGKVDDLRHPGDTITATVGGQPVFVARDKEGNLNGFLNVCRHRGSKLILKDGRYPVVSCPYHRWGYALDGRLLATPLWNTVEGGVKVDMKTMEKEDDAAVAKRKDRAEKRKNKDTKKKTKLSKKERLALLQAQVKADAALIEEAERLALEQAPGSTGPGDGLGIQEGGAATAASSSECSQISAIRDAFDTAHLKKFDKANFHLFSVRAEEWGPLVFVTLDDDDRDARRTEQQISDVRNKTKGTPTHNNSGGTSADNDRHTDRRSKRPMIQHEQSFGAATPSLGNVLGGVVTELADYPLSELVSVRSGTARPRANWKLLQENFMEYYHLPSVHPNLCAVSGVDEHKRRQARGQYVGFVTEPLSKGGTPIDPGVLPDFPGLPKTAKDTAVFHALFTNVFYFLLPSHMFVVRLEPVSPTETIEHADLLVHPT
jgi:phenylpropionate dioxygenase-like ring-hydroxylating dioxygenase large terminal subunit